MDFYFHSCVACVLKIGVEVICFKDSMRIDKVANERWCQRRISRGCHQVENVIFVFVKDIKRQCALDMTESRDSAFEYMARSCGVLR